MYLLYTVYCLFIFFVSLLLSRCKSRIRSEYVESEIRKYDWTSDIVLVHSLVIQTNS